ncbi:hypothetical protein ACFQ0B_22250 [Nonomuraea thailandensis]
MELDGAGLTCAQVHEAAYGGARVTIASSIAPGPRGPPPGS